jgi:hypothetical protein
MIDLRIKHADRLKHSTMQLGFKLTPGIIPVNQFRPIAAAAIYNHLLNEPGTVWDMSCGFGSRLLGAAISRKVVKYIGTDPDTTTMKGLHKLKDKVINIGNLKEVELIELGSEVYVPEKDSLDLCFTSPPYFKAEKYCNEPTQCYIKYSEQEIWNEQFLKKTLWNCYFGLKLGGKLAINVLNTQYHKTLEEDVIKYSIELGFSGIGKLKLLSGKSPRNKQGTDKSLIKFEPVYLFQK